MAHNLSVLGTYAPEQHDAPKHRKPPSYSFGLRTPYHKRDSIPAANAYNLPNVLGPKAVGKISCPAYSMTSRSKIGSFHEDMQKVCQCFKQLKGLIKASRILRSFTLRCKINVPRCLLIFQFFLLRGLLGSPVY